MFELPPSLCCKLNFPVDVVKLARVRVRYSVTIIVYSTIYMHYCYIVTFLLSDKRGVIRLPSSFASYSGGFMLLTTLSCVEKFESMPWPCMVHV